MTTAPFIENGHVVCRCGSRMRCETGRHLDEPGWWIWWRCTANPDHVSCAVPFPHDTYRPPFQAPSR